MNSLRFKNHLQKHGKVSLIDSLIVLGIANPAALVSELRKTYGANTIVTEHETVETLQGNKFRCRVYRLSDEGRKRMFPERKPFVLWCDNMPIKTI